MKEKQLFCLLLACIIHYELLYTTQTSDQTRNHIEWKDKTSKSCTEI